MATSASLFSEVYIKSCYDRWVLCESRLAAANKKFLTAWNKLQVEMEGMDGMEIVWSDGPAPGRELSRKNRGIPGADTVTTWYARAEWLRGSPDKFSSSKLDGFPRNRPSWVESSLGWRASWPRIEAAVKTAPADQTDWLVYMLVAPTDRRLQRYVRDRLKNGVGGRECHTLPFLYVLHDRLRTAAEKERDALRSLSKALAESLKGAKKGPVHDKARVVLALPDGRRLLFSCGGEVVPTVEGDDLVVIDGGPA